MLCRDAPSKRAKCPGWVESGLCSQRYNKLGFAAKLDANPHYSFMRENCAQSCGHACVTVTGGVQHTVQREPAAAGGAGAGANAAGAAWGLGLGLVALGVGITALAGLHAARSTRASEAADTAAGEAHSGEGEAARASGATYSGTGGRGSRALETVV